MFECCSLSCLAITLAGLYTLLYIYNKMFTGKYEGNDRLSEKTVIVTGATSGIGKVCAKDFANRGATVILACRDVDRAERVKSEIIEDTGNIKIKIKRVDFGSLDSVRKCAAEILAEEEKIDILLNNAGAGGHGYKQTDDGLDTLVQANHFGPFLFTNLLLKKMKQSVPSRIVNVSSMAHKYGKVDLNTLKAPRLENAPSALDFTKLYAITKLCNVYFTTELARKLEGTGVTVNCLHPGAFYSMIYRKSAILSFFASIFLPIFAKTVEEGAQTSIFLSVSPSVAKVSGKYFADCKEEKLNKVASDMGIAKKVWEISEDAVKLQPHEKHY